LTTSLNVPIEDASGAGKYWLAFREELFWVDVQRPADALEKVDRGRDLDVLGLAHMATAHVAPMSKLHLAEAAGAFPLLDVQC